MLILSRRADEIIRIGRDITITIIGTGKTVRVGIEAPNGIDVHRDEIYQRINSPGQHERDTTGLAE